jgi:hypothetical protein
MAYWLTVLQWLHSFASFLSDLHLEDYIAIAALVIAFFAFFVAEKRFRGAFKSIQAVAESVSTRNIGPFPDHIQQITNLVGRANE